MTQWTVPSPSPAARAPRTRRPVRAGRIAAGVGLALAGHLVAVLIPILAAGDAAGSTAGDGLWIVTGAVVQVMLFLAAVAGGTVLHGRPETRDLGLGLLIGWGSGIPVVVTIGFVALLFGVSTLS